jgi:polysulfide reductase chain C
MNELIIWRWSIIVYLFLGGLSGGLFAAVAAIESYGLGKQFKKALTWGANLSWLFIILGLVVLIFDLGRPERGIFFMLTPNFTSPMSFGAIILVLFMASGIAYWVAHTGFLLKKILPSLWELLKRFKTIIAAVGGTLGFVTGVYTGVLLSYARYPLWCCPILPLLFLASALSTGLALFLFIAKSTHELEQSNISEHLPKLVILLGVVELLIVLGYAVFLPSEVTSALLSLDNSYSVFFILVFLIGGVFLGEIGLPLIELKKGSEAMFYIATLLTLIGGFTLRVVIVFLGPVI